MSVVDVSPKPSSEPEYMGDGVYAQFDGYQIELYTHNGYEKLTSIFLEPAVYAAIRAYGAKVWELRP